MGACDLVLGMGISECVSSSLTCLISCFVLCALCNVLRLAQEERRPRFGLFKSTQ